MIILQVVMIFPFDGLHSKEAVNVSTAPSGLLWLIYFAKICFTIGARACPNA